jgi:hypothetical protein
MVGQQSLLQLLLRGLRRPLHQQLPAQGSKTTQQQTTSQQTQAVQQLDTLLLGSIWDTVLQRVAWQRQVLSMLHLLQHRS